MQLTRQQREILELLDVLGQAIRDHDWPTALPIWQELLRLYTPLGEYQPELNRVLQRNAAMVQVAERQTSKVH